MRVMLILLRYTTTTSIMKYLGLSTALLV